MNKKGFTLAEVLITLAIIGVVAAIVISGLLQNTNNRELTIGAKKAFAVGNQAIMNAAMTNCGTTDLSCLFSAANSITTIGDAISPQYSISKNCKASSTALGCFNNYNDAIDGSGATLSIDTDNGWYKFITNDGMSIALYTQSSGCTTNFGIDSNSPATKTCGALYVDVNGAKAPNKMGRDVFAFMITSNKAPILYANGGKEDNIGGGGNQALGGKSYWNYNGANLCSLSNANKSGVTCTGRLLEKGWEMDY